MKKLIVGENCVACGYCVSESNFFIEKPDGKATPKDMGLITDEQHDEILHIISECSAQAIKVVDDETTKSGGSVGIAELQKLIDEKLRGFKVKEPDANDFRYHKEKYHTTVAVSKLTSEFKYSDSAFTSGDGIAEREGAAEFSHSIYPLKDMMVKELLVFYKIDRLKKYAYLEEDESNYYHAQNKRVRDILKEIEIKAVELTKGNIVLPKDFASFDFGPDKGYDGNTYCYDLRNAENMAYLANEFPPAGDYSYMVKSFDSGGKWCYDLRNAFEEFKKSVDSELWYRLPISTQQDWIDKALEPYKKIIRDEILKKVATVKNALKQCGFTDSTDTKAALQQDLKAVIDNLKEVKLKMEYADPWDIDTDWNSEYRFTSRSECRKAMDNRVDRLYNDCRYFIEDEICRKLGKDYREQIEKCFTQARLNIQQVYDKYGTKYPSLSVKIDEKDANKQTPTYWGRNLAPDNTQSFNISSFEDVSINIDGDIESFIKKNIIGNKINVYEYLTRAGCRVDDCEDTKTGLFGREVSYTKYGYWIETNEIIDQLLKACEVICDATFNDGYIQKRFRKMLGSVINQLEKLT